MVAAAIIGGVATIGSAVASSSAASSASHTAAQTADKNNALQEQIYDQNKAALAPYEGAGDKATPAINALLGLSDDGGAAAKAYSDWQNSTGYQFSLTQGRNAVTAALGAKGLTDSGAALKALDTYGQNTANQNFQTYLGDLSGQQGVGLSAASAQAGVGQNYANAVTQNNNTAAEASENAALTNGSNITGVLGNLVSGVGLLSGAGLGSSYASFGGNNASIDRDIYSNATTGAEGALSQFGY